MTCRIRGTSRMKASPGSISSSGHDLELSMGRSPMVDLQIRLLSPVECWSELRQIPLGTPKQSCLLAVLAFSPGRPVSAETLVDRIWGDEPPEKPYNSLYTYVARLRSILRHATDGDVV